jgi:hypothetical protein
MKIGVFGDSFADQTITNHSTAWWRYLQNKHGHDVICYGKPGSSIAFSASLILEHHQAYDVNIWCLTSPNRFSVKLPSGEYFHSAMFVSHEGADLATLMPDEVKDFTLACKYYHKYLSDWKTDALVGRSVAHYIQHQVPNLIIVPCFRPPLQSDFSLYQLSVLEMETLMPGATPDQVFRSYHDMRSCHLTNINNELLADMLHTDLSPRVFTANYQDFSFSESTIKQAFKPTRRSR